jgi:hypothetical protein
MKNLIYIIALSVLISGCLPDRDFPDHNLEYVGIPLQGVTNTVLEDSPSPLSVPVVFGGALQNEQSFTVNYSVTGGVYGTDYTIVDGASANGTVTIPSGVTGTVARATIQIQPIANSTTNSNKVLTVTLLETSAGVSVGYPQRATINITILDDDCDFVRDEFTGSFEVDEPGYGTYNVNLSADPDNPNGVISDNFWDFSGIVKYSFDPASNVLTLPTQTVEMGGISYTVSQGTGNSTYNDCNITFVVPYTVTRQPDNEVVDDNVHTFRKVD